MNLLGVIQTATGDPETALRTMRVVESIRSKANDEILLAVTWETTGIAHFKAGNLSSALERLMQADTVFGKATDRNSLLDLRKGHNDLALGNVLRAMNKLDDALATWKYAANLVGKESPTHMLKAGLMYKTAQILLDKADWTSAKPILEEALEIATFRLSEGDIARISWTLARCLRMELGSLDQTSSLRKNLDDSLEQRALALDGVAYGLRKKLRVQFGLDVIESNLRQASIEEKNTEERFVKIQLKDDGSDSSSGKERGRTTKQQELAAKYEELNSFDNLVGPFFR